MVRELLYVSWLHIIAAAFLCLDASAQQLCLPLFVMFPPIPFFCLVCLK